MRYLNLLGELDYPVGKNAHIEGFLRCNPTLVKGPAETETPITGILEAKNLSLVPLFMLFANIISESFEREGKRFVFKGELTVCLQINEFETFIKNDAR